MHSESICHKKSTHLWQTLICFTWVIDAVNFDRPSNNFCRSISIGRLNCTIQHGLHQLRIKSQQDYSAIAALARGMQWTKLELPQRGQQFPPNTGIGKMCERITSTCSNERTIPTRPPPPLCRVKGILLANQQELQTVGAEGVKAARWCCQSSWMTELWLLNRKCNSDKKKPRTDGWTGQTLAKYRACRL